jgi:hypothetical protein
MRYFRLTAGFAIFLLCFCAMTASAQNPARATAELARRIVAFTGRRLPFHLTFTNRSSAGVAQVAALRRSLDRDLRAVGARLASATVAGSDVQVDVALSQTWRNLVLVAQMQRGKTSRVVIMPLPRFTPQSGEHDAAVVSLERQIVWRQHLPFVSFLLWQTPREKSSFLWVLEPYYLELYHLVQGQWHWQAGAYISHDRPLPRDVRGLLWIGPPGSQLHAALPGVDCSMPLVPARGGLPLSCHVAPGHSALFPILQAGAAAAEASLVPQRNYFAAATQLGRTRLQLRPFYSATIVDQDHAQPVLLAAATDGKTYLYNDAGKSEGTIDGWGSNIAGIKTACGSGWQVLATRPGDWTVVDSLAAYEIVDRNAVAIGEPIDFPGPVIGLSPAPDGRTADAVVLDRDAGLYEAYTISLSCGR